MKQVTIAIMAEHPDRDLLAPIIRRIEKLLTDKNLTAYQLSIRSGVDRAAISRILNGESGLTVSTLLKLIDGLDVSYDEFFKGISA